jgi:hypothetical protein
MSMSVFRLRVEGLIRHLEEAQDPNRWLGSLELSRRPEQNLWLKAVEGIGKEAEGLLVDLRKCVAQLPEGAMPTPDDWQLYFTTQARSEEIFRESLELLGGLALRDRMTDEEEYVCRFADELISECAEFVGKPTSFAIPAFEDTLSSTLRRVARVGFPDWHLWTLPLVAYEYGQVVVRETNLKRLVTEYAREAAEDTLDDLMRALASRFEAIDSDSVRRMCELLISAPPEDRYSESLGRGLADMLNASDEAVTADLVKATLGSIRECVDEANSRMRVLVSDAFATFTAGPAYACAALILRLNPTSPRGPGRPADSERAATILAVLSGMDGSSPPAFASIHRSLASSWEQLRAGTETADRSPGVRSTTSPISVQRTLSRIRERMLKPDQAEYSQVDWLRAEGWGRDWWQAISIGTDLCVPRDADEARMRDVLNAAWHCRLSIMDNLAPSGADAAKARVKAVARQVCDQIIKQRKDRRGGPTFGGRAPRPR